MAKDTRNHPHENIEICTDHFGDNVDRPPSCEKYVPNKEMGDVSVGISGASKKNERKSKVPEFFDRGSGTMLAGPGEDRRLIYFDVKAFFEDQRHIRNVGRDHNMSFRISGDAQIMRDILRAHGFLEMPLNSRFNNFSWIGNSVSELCIDQLLCYQSINHFVGSTSLTRKDKLYENISKMKQKKGAENFNFVPTSFVLPKEMREFKVYYKQNPGPFIVKPVGLSRGRGVYLIGKPTDIVNIREEQVVSRYIRNPLLIDGYKVDLRIYVLVTSFNPLVIYIYQEGLTRFATVKYKNNPNNLHVLRMHLTNYSINVCSGNFIRNEDSSIEDFGSKWTLSALLRYFHAQGIDTVGLMRSIEDVIIKTILAVEKPIASGCRIYQRRPSNCFELFGFDIMLDENYKPWLLEVNLSPSLVCTTPLDIKVKSNMLCDLLNLVGVEVYPKQKPTESNSVSGIFSAYIHRTVGYFCLCIIRDKIRQLLLRHWKSKRFNKIMGAYTDSHVTSNAELCAQERERAKNMSRLHPKEHAMITRVKNEGTRAGGWVKIFPTVNSWRKYKRLMQYQTVQNVILHQSLYPDQHSSLTRDDRSVKTTFPTKSEQVLLKNTKWYQTAESKELRIGLKEMLQRLKRYHSSLEISPPPMFTVKPCSRDFGKSDDDLLKEEALRMSLRSQIYQGYAFTDVQARTAFQRYLTNVKQCLRCCTFNPKPQTCPPISVVKNLLFKFLGQSSDLVIDPTKPLAEYTLDSCLTNFLYHYHKETKLLMNTEGSSIQANEDDTKKINPDLFEEFMHSADQWELEDLLITYIKIHGDASIFLRDRILNRPPRLRRRRSDFERPIFH